MILDDHNDVVTVHLADAAHVSTFRGEFHGILEKVVDRRSQLTPVAENDHGWVGLLEGDLYLQLARRLADALGRFGHHEVYEHRLARR